MQDVVSYNRLLNKIMSRKNIDVKRLLQARTNRNSRLDRPSVNCLKTILQCKEASELILAKSIDEKVADLLERSVVISTVTAVEVYFRDLLSTIFDVCVPDFFEPHLKQLYQEKIDITELFDLHRHQVNPLELVVAAQSFQSLARIDHVFSKFLSTNTTLIKSVLKVRLRVKGDLSDGVGFSEDNIKDVNRLFMLRLELVHDPARRSFFNEETLNDILSAGGLVAMADVVVMEAIKLGLKPEFSVDQGK